MIKQDLKKYVAEFIGTFVLVLFACGVASVTGCLFPQVGYIATALAFGLCIVAMAYSLGNVSGCHVNPAVSVAVLISGGMKFKDFCGYVVAQFLGAISGSYVLMWLLGSNKALGQNHLYDGDIIKSLVIETILTFVFVITVLGVTSKAENNRISGIVIGLSLTLVHLFGIYFTGTSVNPARSFGPALFTGAEALSCIWVFLLAPVIGGALAALVYKLVCCKKQ